MYRGRFAPSPTGPLHFGSLLAAAGSWLDARRAEGEWLLRIEDLDPPREPPGAADEIRRALEAFGLWWDGEIMFQSRRNQAYDAALAQLAADGWTYPCKCSRAQIEAANRRRGSAGSRVYPGTCRDRACRSRTRILRVRTTHELLELSDRLQGRFAQVLAGEVGDFVLRRREGYIAYQLAVVVDDHAQGITDVVRGIDLLDSTPRQLWLQRLLGYATPRYMHLPVVVRPDGEKLSKQTGAAGVDLRAAPALVQQVLACLRLELPACLAGAPPAEQWAWAISRWQPQQLAGVRSMPAP
jgi:glutamyl-Q tRNA(Asp) synthetase